MAGTAEWVEVNIVPVDQHDPRRCCSMLSIRSCTAISASTSRRWPPLPSRRPVRRRIPMMF